MSSSTQPFAETDIAIVGMAGRFAGARDIEEYWRNLRAGIESLTQLTDEEIEAAGVDRRTRTDPNYVKSAFLLDDVEMFDPAFFGLSPKEGAIMDPQHRHFLECAWAATEHAGYAPENFSGRIGVYAGCGMNNYLIHNLLSNPQLVRSEGMFLLRHTGNDKDFLATRVSYSMNLTGPSLNVQTACSTSLVAMHIACQSLLNGECDLALAGGSTLRQPHRAGYLYEEGGVVAPDGHCRAFDAQAEGTVFGSGTGVVVLRRMSDALKDGDTIHAVIKGTAINNDGSQKVGYLAPSVDRQAEAVAEAIAISGVDASTITYVETHGTGTPVGDPIEIAALTEAFRRDTDRSGYCAIGSVKTNIGHCDTAAGVASVIKVAQALKHREIPPSLNYAAPNPTIDFAQTPFFVNAALQPWHSSSARRAGINSLGVGGTNAHIVMEEAPQTQPSGPLASAHLLVLSAKNKAALDRAASNLAAHLRTQTDTNLGDAAFTLQLGRTSFRQRRVVAGSTREELIDGLESTDAKRVITGEAAESEPPLAFMFSGGGAQYATMGAELYESEPVFREEADRCLAILTRLLDYDPRSLLYPAGNVEAASRELERPSRALPALFLTQYALARLLMSWGLKPDAFIGHSMGEYTAAHLAGVFSLEDALALVTMRGKLFEQVPEGGMLSVNLSAQELAALLPAELSIAAINAPELCVASGPTHAINALQQQLEARDVQCQRVHISIAAHSAMLEPILAEFGRFFQGITLRAPELPFASNVSGMWITAAEATDPNYWVRHLRNTVRFADGMAELLKQPNRALIEVGPGRTLTTLARLNASFGANHAAVQTMRHPDEVRSDVAYLLESVGRLWLKGQRIDWSALHRSERRRIPLPTYSFERVRCWYDPGRPSAAIEEGVKPEKRSDVGEWFYQASWKRSLPPRALSTAHERVLVLRDSSAFHGQLTARLRGLGFALTEVEAGDQFARIGDERFVINARVAADYETLLDALAQSGALPRHILHLWNVTPEPKRPGLEVGAPDAQMASFYSLLYLAQAMGRADLSDPLDLLVVSNNMQSVAGETWLAPIKALAIGPCRVIGQEFPNVTCRSIDVVVPPAGGRQERRLIEQLTTELSTGASADTIIALRGPDRWVQSFEPAPLAPAATSPLRDGGTYVITGGLGGIALEVAERFARKARVNLVLVGRTELPPRDQWAGWYQANGDQDRTSRRIQKIEQIEGLGAQVVFLRASVTDQAALSSALASVRKQFGAINGVVHTAGVLHDQLILMKEAEEAERVLAPKVQGTLVLYELLRGDPLDFFLLFSSRGSISGVAGQVDYAAANAFLDAFAHAGAALDGVAITALNWSAWQQVGMVAEMMRDRSVVSPAGEPTSHPLLDRRLSGSEAEETFATDFARGRHWVLDDHRIRGGDALIPGTGYLELARAAFEQQPRAGVFELTDVFFITPFMIRAGERRELRVTLRANADGLEFAISGSRNGAGFQDHVTGQMASRTADEPAARDLSELLTRCNQREEIFAARQREHLELGPRWDSLKRISYGQGEAMAWLELPEEFAGELETYKLHPALLDVATACAQPLIPGFSADEHFYVPASYTRLVSRRALPRCVYSHIRYRPNQNGDTDMAVFDVTILDDQGVEIVDISEFVMMRVTDRAALGKEADPNASQVGIGASAPRLVIDLEDAITPDEGMDALDRILSAGALPQVVVSPQDLPHWLKFLRASASARPAAPTAQNKASVFERVDAAEIALREHEAIAEAVVLARRDRHNVRLVAYVVYHAHEFTTPSELRRFLRERLAEEQVPQNFVELDALPTRADGQPDLSALPDPFAADDDYVAPRTDAEKLLADIWRELLGVERVSVHDNFLDVGGHSLLALRAISRVAKKTGVRLSPSAFNLQTLEQIAASLQPAGASAPNGGRATTEARTQRTLSASL
ncbi:MAG: SDR family NAD(P)-dependent oxidoreductase [Longimicrobiales bacterium]